MNLNIVGSSNTVEVSDATFGREFNEALVHQVVTAYMAGGRQGTKAQKNRSAVSGGGIKPFRQKGTGRARAGTIRSPIWVGGGKTFAATPRDFSQKVNKKMYRGAVSAILSELVRQERLIVVDEITVAEPKTKAFIAKMNELGASNALIITDTVDENLFLSSRNVPHVFVTDTVGVNPVNLVAHEKVLVTAEALKKIEESLA